MIHELIICGCRIPRLALLLLFLSTLALISCRDKETVPPPQRTQAELKESLIKANQYLMRNEESDIEAYIARHQLVMNTTTTGLRYAVLFKGGGARPYAGSTVSLEYTISLINGDKLYDSGNEGLKSFVLGKSDEISGLEEGIFLLGQGDQAKFIIPSHLAFGLSGDGKKVPKRASLVYDVKLVLVK